MTTQDHTQWSRSNEAQRAHIMGELGRGRTVRQVADSLGLSTQRVYKIKAEETEKAAKEKRKQSRNKQRQITQGERK